MRAIARRSTLTIAAALGIAACGERAPAVSSGLPSIQVTRIARPSGVDGACVAVAAQGDVRVAVWADGSVTTRRKDGVARAGAPSGDERFRRAVVDSQGRVVAISTRGRLYAVAGASVDPLPLRTQPGSHLVAGPDENDLWSAGEAGALRHLDPRTGDVTEPWGSGSPPFTALLLDGGHLLAGGVEGGVGRAPVAGGPGIEALRLPKGITALARTSGWIAAGDEDGHVRVVRSSAVAPKPGKNLVQGASADVGGGVVGIVFPSVGEDGIAHAAPLLVVHLPSSATVLLDATYQTRASKPLGSAPRDACALAPGGALYVATDDGEVEVSITR